MHKRVYLAGPFFNPEQVKLRDTIKDMLESRDFDVFSPGHDNLMTPKTSQKDLVKGFRKNLSEIENCDIILAIGNGYDTGTMIEIGYALKCGKPIIYFNDSKDGKVRNLMIAGASLFYVQSLAKLGNILSMLDNASEVIE